MDNNNENPTSPDGAPQNPAQNDQQSDVTKEVIVSASETVKNETTGTEGATTTHVEQVTEQVKPDQQAASQAYQAPVSSQTQPVSLQPQAQPMPAQTQAQVTGAVPPHGQSAHYQSTASYHAPQHAVGHTPPQPHYQQSYQNAQTPAPVAPAKSTVVTKSGGGGKSFLLGLLGGALVCLLGLGIFWALMGSNLTSSGSSTSGGTTVLGSEGGSINAADQDMTLAEAVADKALPSVASIDVYASATGGFGFGGGSDELVQSSLGSGVVLSADGYIITNYHVIEGAESLTVTVGGEQYEAEIVGTDPESDLAVIKANGVNDLTPIEIGSSSELTIGEWVMAIGSPFGLEQSVSTGVVSAKSRSQILESQTGTSIYANMIQTDAAINPGNSGGALVDSNGKLIGINTLISSSSGSSAGVGFAIPVDYAINIAEQIINGETPSHAQLGVNLSSISAGDAERYGLSADQGAYVSQVNPGSGAEAAGIQAGDIITSFNGNTVTSASDLILEVRSLNPGDTATVELNRSGETLTVEVTLGSDANTSQSSYSGSGGWLDAGQLADAA